MNEIVWGGFCAAYKNYLNVRSYGQNLMVKWFIMGDVRYDIIRLIWAEKRHGERFAYDGGQQLNQSMYSINWILFHFVSSLM